MIFECSLQRTRDILLHPFKSRSIFLPCFDQQRLTGRCLIAAFMNWSDTMVDHSGKSQLWWMCYVWPYSCLILLVWSSGSALISVLAVFVSSFRFRHFVSCLLFAWLLYVQMYCLSTVLFNIYMFYYINQKLFPLNYIVVNFICIINLPSHFWRKTLW